MPHHFQNTRLHHGARYFHPTQEVYLKIFNFCIRKHEIYISSLFRYFTVGGSPAQVIEMLSQNYSASAQMANLMAEWLILAGATITDVQSMVENHLKEMILKTFDPKKADTIFTEEGEVISLSLIIYLNFLTICFLIIYRLLPG